MKTNITYLLFAVALVTVISVNVRAQTINTYAGSAALGAGFSGDGSNATGAQLDHPKSVALDDTGNLYIADANNNRIRKVNTAGVITTLAGVTAAGFGGDGGICTFANFDHPNYVAVDRANNIYISDADNQRIRKIDTAGIINTIVGDGTAGYIGDGGPATAAEINFVSAIALDTAGNLYIADQDNNVVRKVNTSGVISTIAGNGSSGAFSGEGGPATAATLGFPMGITVDAGGNLYVSLYYDSRVCKIAPSGTITTYAGIGGGTGLGLSGDGGPATAAQFDSPWGITIDHPGNLYISDDGNNVVRKVSPSGIVTTFAGTGSYNYSGDGGPATAAKFRDPIGFAVSPDGSVYIADLNNGAVRKVNGTLTHPPAFTGGHSQVLTVCENASATSINSLMSASDLDVGQLETWSVAAAPLHGSVAAAYNANSTGTAITPTGLTYTPAASYAGPDSFKVRVYDGTASDTTTVHVTVNTCTTGIPIANNAGVLEIFPNPNPGIFTFNLSSGTNEKIRITITSLTGQKIQEIVTNTDLPTQISFNGSPGIYFLNAVTANGSWSRKIIVMP